MKTRMKIAMIAAAVVVAAGVGVGLFHGKLFSSSASTVAAKNAVSYSTVAVSKGDVTSTVSASGQLEPSTTVTIRPDSNMPTRKITKVLVSAGQTVKVGQAIAEIEATGLDLSLKSAEANYLAQVAKLENLKAKPADMDIAAAEATLLAATAAMESAQSTYDNEKILVDKGLAAKSTLDGYAGTLATAKATYESDQLSYQNVQGQSAEADIKAQESEVATADYDRQMAKIVLDSTVIRSPSAGVVAEVLVDVGDLVSPSTSIAYVVDTNPMLLVASVNENDMPSVKVGETATITQAAYSDDTFTGVVTGIDLHASTSSNVSTFSVTIKVGNGAGKLLWGMNADAEITVVSLKNVLTLPSSAVKSSNGKSTVTVVDESGQLVSSAVTIGATDGSKTQILSGLVEGQLVVAKSSKTATSASSTAKTASASGESSTVRSLTSMLSGGGAGGPPGGGAP